MNKKGFIRTLEAVIAIVLILGFIFYITPRVVEFEEKTPDEVANAKEFILNQILYHKDYSQCIANAGCINNQNCICENVLDNSQSIINVGDTTVTCKGAVIDLIETHIPLNYYYQCEICNAGDANPTCSNLPSSSNDKSIYTNSILIYKSPTESKIMRLYIWKK